MAIQNRFIPLLACLLISCASEPEAPTSLSLAGTQWLAEDIGGRGVMDMAQSTVRFDQEGRAAGNGGCNRYFGEYTLVDSSLRFGTIGSTRMACPEALMNQEQDFFAALEATRSYRLDALTDLLFFIDEKGTDVLRFSRQKAAASFE
ncbi:MAG: META domain-containing protein [Gammaproteobacteria bacterium]